MIRETQLHYEDRTGTARVLRIAGGGLVEADGVGLSLSTAPLSGGTIVHTQLANRGGLSIRLRWIRFELETGFDPGSAARFFKHGYQSWSTPYPAMVHDASPQPTGSLLTRIGHQSEPERPEDAPESATSELFTIVESDSSSERFFCGFIGAANQLSTVTVTSPERITARALFDGVWLNPGDSVAVEPLTYWRSDEEPSRMAARWAGLLGRHMGARVGSPYQRGWCSWYHYFDAITENALRSNLGKLREMRAAFPVEVVQIDDGFQAALGDWDATNAKFPSGLRSIADEIRRAGFTAGLWTAPFLATRDSHLMGAHPDWFIHNKDGEPLAVANNASWTAGEDKFAYALDASHPEFIQHLERLFRRLVHEFGFGYLKLDFLFAAAADGIRHNPNLTRAQTLRRGLETIRRAAGNETFILGCGCPLGAAVGIVDGMRIGPDVAPYWGGDVEPGTRLAIDAIIMRSSMHRRLWLNDPDCLMLRTSETRLSREERFALAAAIAVSGGMMLFSDDANLLGDDSKELLQLVTRIGIEVDNGAAVETPIANLMNLTSLRTLGVRSSQRMFHLLVNTGETGQEIATAAIIAGKPAKLLGPDGESECPERFELSPHSARILCWGLT